MKIAKILINTSVRTLNKVYDYLVPNTLEDNVTLGKRVEVQFGRSRGNEEGIVVKIEEKTKTPNSRGRLRVSSAIPKFAPRSKRLLTKV